MYSTFSLSRIELVMELARKNINNVSLIIGAVKQFRYTLKEEGTCPPACRLPEYRSHLEALVNHGEIPAPTPNNIYFAPNVVEELLQVLENCAIAGKGCLSPLTI